jgi:3-deoxy-D-manno-octulosonic-acid transferase
VIAPRHPERGRGIAEIATAAGLPSTPARSGNCPSTRQKSMPPTLLASLAPVYRLAPVVFVGGSLIRHGGQNPVEAAKLGAAILHGPCLEFRGDLFRARQRPRCRAD